MAVFRIFLVTVAFGTALQWWSQHHDCAGFRFGYDQKLLSSDIPLKGTTWLTLQEHELNAVLYSSWNISFSDYFSMSLSTDFKRIEMPSKRNQVRVSRRTPCFQIYLSIMVSEVPCHWASGILQRALCVLIDSGERIATNKSLCTLVYGIWSTLLFTIDTWTYIEPLRSPFFNKLLERNGG